MTRVRNAVNRDIVRFTRSATVRSLIGLVVGAGLTVATLTLDRVLQLTAPVPLDNARMVLGALLGGVLSVAVFTLWMRTVVVGLTSGQVSPRVASNYLDDTFQRTVTGLMVGGLTYIAGVSLMLPTALGEQGVPPAPAGGVPLISGSLAMLVAVAALVALLTAMRHAVTSMSPPHVIRQLTDRVSERLAHPHLPNDTCPEVMPDPLQLYEVRSPSMGWLRSVDYVAVARELPPDTTALLPIAVGEFVAPGDTILLCDPDTKNTDAIIDAIAIDRSRDTQEDLAFAIQQLVDVVQHALGPGSNDTSTAHEAFVHLRAILHGVLRRSPASACFAGDDGRRIVCTAAWDSVDYLHAAVERLCHAAARDPVATRVLGETLKLLEITASEVGDERSEALLIDEQERLTKLADATT